MSTCSVYGSERAKNGPVEDTAYLPDIPEKISMHLENDQRRLTLRLLQESKIELSGFEAYFEAYSK